MKILRYVEVLTVVQCNIAQYLLILIKLTFYYTVTLSLTNNHIKLKLYFHLVTLQYIYTKQELNLKP